MDGAPRAFGVGLKRTATATTTTRTTATTTTTATTRAGRGRGYFPTHVAVRLRHGWGTPGFWGWFEENSNSNDNYKSNGNYNNNGNYKSWQGKGILSHPCRGEAAPWMGHPGLLGLV